MWRFVMTYCTCSNVLPGVAERGREVEAADTAGHAHQPRHDADLLPEALRHELEHRAVAHAERQHGADEDDQRHPCLGQAEADDRQEHRGKDVHQGQRLHATDAVGHIAADRPHQRTGEHAAGGEEARRLRIQPVLRIEVDHQRGRQTDEAAEGHRVEEHEPPGVLVLQHLQVLADGLRRRRIRRILGHEAEGDEDDHQRDQGEAEHVRPAEAHGEAGREQGGEGRARVACAGDAHRRALVLGRIPARRQRQCRSEGRAGDTEENAQHQHLGVGMHARQPGVGERGDDDHLADDGRLLRRQAIDQHAHHQAQQRTGQHRRGDHEALLRMRQAEIGGDAHRERAKQHPHHEGEVEIQEGGKQRGRMAGLKEGFLVHGESSCRGWGKAFLALRPSAVPGHRPR